MRPIPASAGQETGFRFDMPAPVGGWNARDNIARMSPADALILDNWFPGTTEVEVRQGYAASATIPAGQSVQSLMGLAKPDGTFKRFTASAAGIYDITAGGAIAAVDSAATTGKWEYTQINVGGTAYLWCCAGDGINDSRIYNSTTGLWTLLNGGSVPALTGITSNAVSNVSQFKNRLILCERSSLKFYYGPLNSVGGAFTAFDLGAVFQLGGYLVATASWTVDAGQGVDDHFVAITSEGEVALYKGTDPSSAAAFSLVGIYQVGKPTGKRCFFKLAGDVGILTQQGLWPISKALLSATVDKRVALTDKVQDAFAYAFSQYSSQFGWQAVLLAKGPAIIVNIPTGLTSAVQFVMNTITGAWCRFTGWDATALLVLDGKLYFGAGNVVKEGWTGTVDGNSAITCSASTAFSHGPTRARGKKINMVKPIIQASAPVNVSMALDTDFQQRTALTTQASLGSGGTGWDSALWDLASWADGTTTINKWKTVRHKPGGAFSLRLRIQVKNIIASWSATDFLGEAGNLLS